MTPGASSVPAPPHSVAPPASENPAEVRAEATPGLARRTKPGARPQPGRRRNREERRRSQEEPCGPGARAPRFPEQRPPRHRPRRPGLSGSPAARGPGLGWPPGSTDLPALPQRRLQDQVSQNRTRPPCSHLQDKSEGPPVLSAVLSVASAPQRLCPLNPVAAGPLPCSRCFCQRNLSLPPPRSFPGRFPLDYVWVSSPDGRAWASGWSGRPASGSPTPSSLHSLLPSSSHTRTSWDWGSLRLQDPQAGVPHSPHSGNHSLSLGWGPGSAIVEPVPEVPYLFLREEAAACPRPAPRVLPPLGQQQERDVPAAEPTPTSSPHAFLAHCDSASCPADLQWTKGAPRSTFLNCGTAAGRRGTWSSPLQPLFPTPTSSL